MKYLIIAGFLITSLSAISQKTGEADKDVYGSAALNYVYTVNGTPFMTAKFARVTEGSAFFNDQPMKGILVLSNGKQYNGVFMKLNLLESQVNYMKDKVEMVTTTPVREAILLDTVGNKEHFFIHSSYIGSSEIKDKGFYELLQPGTAELYKFYKKEFSETKPYGSATVEQTIKTDIRYYILYNKQWVKIKKAKDLAAVFTDKKNEIQKYITENKLTDNQADLEALASYYNSLVAKQ